MFKYVCEMFIVVLELGQQPGPVLQQLSAGFLNKKRPLRPHTKIATSRRTGVIYGKWQGSWRRLQACETVGAIC